MDQLSYDCFVADTADMSRPRHGGRDALLLSARMRSGIDGAPRQARVRNISPGGLMAECTGSVDIDEAVAIEVHGIGWVSGRVAWIAEGRVGIAFDETIDPARINMAEGAEQPR